MNRTRFRRPLWFTAGATVGLLAAVLTTQAFSVSASDDPAESSFVAIAPCRLLDTRPSPDNIGPRSGALGAAEELDVQVSGSPQGNCAIPSSATAVSINLTATGATHETFVSSYPAGIANPGTSSLNIVPGASPTTNEIDVQLSAGGAITLFNAHGSVDLIGDVTGYYTASGFETIESQLQQLDQDNDTVDQRLLALESRAAPESYVWEFEGTVDGQGGPSTTFLVPAGATVSALAADFDVTSYDPDCSAQTVLYVSDGSVSDIEAQTDKGIWVEVVYNNGSTYSSPNTLAHTNTSNVPQPLRITARCTTFGYQTLTDFALEITGSLTFRIDEAPTTVS